MNLTIFCGSPDDCVSREFLILRPVLTSLQQLINCSWSFPPWQRFPWSCSKKPRFPVLTCLSPWSLVWGFALCPPLTEARRMLFSLCPPKLSSPCHGLLFVCLFVCSQICTRLALWFLCFSSRTSSKWPSWLPNLNQSSQTTCKHFLSLPIYFIGLIKPKLTLFICLSLTTWIETQGEDKPFKGCLPLFPLLWRVFYRW